MSLIYYEFFMFKMKKKNQKKYFEKNVKIV